MKKMRIISLLAVVILLISSLGIGVHAAETETKEPLTATVESTILIAGDDPVSVKINDGTIVSAKSSNEKVATFDLKTNTIKPVGKGDATITITNSLGETTTVDVKVYGSSLSLGVETALLGMGIVFSVLVIIWAILAVFGKVATAGTKKEKPAPAPKAAPAPVAPAPTASAPAPSASDDSELVAAITAAVSLCMDMPVGSFRVVSFRKTNTKQAWNKK
ncbi:MAG: hypothetical protein E7616_04040 [Ruminococcaceae bacterium]|nr:hypothetical protein [Oscillospiraceae bacterium]